MLIEECYFLAEVAVGEDCHYVFHPRIMLHFMINSWYFRAKMEGLRMGNSSLIFVCRTEFCCIQWVLRTILNSLLSPETMSMEIDFAEDYLESSFPLGQNPYRSVSPDLFIRGE